jgi:hypothetical protein
MKAEGKRVAHDKRKANIIFLNREESVEKAFEVPCPAFGWW